MADEEPPPPYREGLPFLSVGPQGHRSRMRMRLLSNGPDGLADYEVLEMLLFLSIPRRDTKPLAKAIINRFGDFCQALTAAPPDLHAFRLDEPTIAVFELVTEAARRLSLAEPRSRPLLNSNAGLDQYLDPATRLQRPAHGCALLLNTRNQLLSEMPLPEAQPPSDVVRAIARRAVELHAGAVILASFRPGDGPVLDDRSREIARRMAKMGGVLSLTLHDHLIFAAGERYSLRQLGML
jgi:DNA repair protein RadC